MRGSDLALLGIQFKRQDLSSVGGRANAAVQGFVVEYRRPGKEAFLWSTFDHCSLSDAASDISLKGQNVDPWHANAIEIDDDGNLLVSFRNSDEILKINSETGSIMWRLGGKNSQFSFRNDKLGGFSHQHGIRRLANGHILLFDDGNLHSPPMSRAVEYRLDESAKIAELVWEYRPDPPIFGFALGFAQRLPNGNTLVCFGTAQHIIEVDQGGVKRWELIVDEPQRFAYRAFAIESLY
jgi:outer membrane protein assembly factor BamB